MGEGARGAEAVALAVTLDVLASRVVGVAGGVLGVAAVATGGADGTASPLAPHDVANSAITAAHVREKFLRVDGSRRTPPYNPSLMARVPSRDSSIPERLGSELRAERPLESCVRAEPPLESAARAQQPLESRVRAEQPQPLEALDPWARERIERAVAPYRASMSAADLDWMRAQLALAMEDDPEVSATVRAARGASAEASGTVRRGDGGER
ncbi:MAG: hypothetical protein WKG00_02685 [Polyangiaceae bacterium]